MDGMTVEVAHIISVGKLFLCSDINLNSFMLKTHIGLNEVKQNLSNILLLSWFQMSLW